MAPFSDRPLVYKVGMLVLLVALIMFLTGFATPHWVSMEYSGSVQDTSVYTFNFNQGLWMYCSSRLMNSDCEFLGIEGLAAWFHIVRLLESLGLIGMSVSLLLSVNRLEAFPLGLGRFLQIFCAFLAGTFGFIGCVMHVGVRKKHPDMADNNYEARFDRLLEIQGLAELTMSWSFFLCIVASILSIIAGVLLAGFRKSRETTTRNVDRSSVFFTTAATQGHCPGQGPGQGRDQVEMQFQGQGYSRVGGQHTQGATLVRPSPFDPALPYLHQPPRGKPPPAQAGYS